MAETTEQSGGRLRFFRTFLSNPLQVGAVVPSGRELTRQILSGIDFDHAKVLVELGPGTGAFTKEVVKRRKGDTRVLAVELNPDMAEWIARRHPEVELVRDDARNLRRHLRARGIDRVDAVISGLPFTVFPAHVQSGILESVHDALAPGGQFVTFSYYHTVLMPSAHRFEKLLERTFRKVERLPAIWNVPPAFVFRCRR